MFSPFFALARKLGRESIAETNAGSFRLSPLDGYADGGLHRERLLWLLNLLVAMKCHHNQHSKLEHFAARFLDFMTPSNNDR